MTRATTNSPSSSIAGSTTCVRRCASRRTIRSSTGVQQTIDDLLNRGYLLGVVTGNVEPAAHVKLHRANLNRFFCFGGYGSDSEDRGEVTRFAVRRATLVYGAPLGPDHCIVVGDTPHDAEAAHAAGVACVGVASHNFDEDQLRKGGADWVIPSLAHGLPDDALA